MIKNNLERLMDDISTRPFVIFVGAGINGHSVPQWNNFILSLLEPTIKEIVYRERLNNNEEKSLNELIATLHNDGDLDAYAEATLIKNILGKKYVTYLRKIIYKDFNDNEFSQYITDRRSNNETSHKEKYETMFQTAKLCCESNVKAVVTYNFDNLLETAIDKLGKKNVSISPSQETGYIDKSILPVYHVHGMIPTPASKFRNPEPNIVLSRDEYFQNMLEPYSWQTTTQLYFLMNYTCLFIGTSLTDWNMLRMLSFGKKPTTSTFRYVIRMYSKFDNNEGITGKITDIWNKIQTTLFDKVGLRTISVNDLESLWRTIQKISDGLNIREVR